MKIVGSAAPGHAWVKGCQCHEVLIDWELRSVYHPHYTCPHYGHATMLDVVDTKPL